MVIPRIASCPDSPQTRAPGGKRFQAAAGDEAISGEITHESATIQRRMRARMIEDRSRSRIAFSVRLSAALLLAGATPAHAQLRPAPARPAEPPPLPAGETWRHERAVAAHGFTIDRWRRHVDGVPVAGGTGVVAVRTARDGHVDLVSGDGGPGAVDRAGARLTARDAGRLALALVARLAWRSPRVALADEVFAPFDGVLVRAWQIEIAAARTQRLRVLVDARDGAILGAESLVHHALGR